MTGRGTYGILKIKEFNMVNSFWDCSPNTYMPFSICYSVSRILSIPQAYIYSIASILYDIFYIQYSILCPVSVYYFLYLHPLSSYIIYLVFYKLYPISNITIQNPIFYMLYSISCIEHLCPCPVSIFHFQFSISDISIQHPIYYILYLMSIFFI